MKIKKLSAILLALLMLLSAFSACAAPETASEATEAPASETEESTSEEAPAEESASESNIVNIFHRWPESDGNDTHNEIITMIAEQHPEIEIINEVVPGNMYEVQLTVKLAASDAPDVFGTWPGGRIEYYVANGTAKNLNDLWEEYDLENMYIDAINGGTLHYDGNRYVVPHNIMPNTIYYSTNIFDDLDLDVPTDWEEFLAVCEAIKASGVTPIASGSTPERWGLGFWFDYFLLNTAGGEFRENLMQGKESWESEEVYKAFEMWKELLDKGYFNSDISAVDPNQIPTAYIAQGKAAMMLNGPWTTPSLENAGLVAGEDFNSFTFPQLDPNIPPSSEGAIDAWAVNSATDSYDAVKIFLGAWASKEMSDYYTVGEVTSNPRKDVTFEELSEGTRLIAESLLPQYEDKTLHNNYELATIPTMQEAGLNAFVAFVTAPDTYKEICADLQATAEIEFAAYAAENEQ